MPFTDMKLFEFHNPRKPEKTMLGFFKFEKYWYNNNTAIRLYAKDKDDAEDFFEPYCSVSVNVIKAKPQSDSCIFVDTNNAPFLESLLQEKGFGLPTGRFATSGYCCYPEYLLNIKKMKEYQMYGNS